MKVTLRKLVNSQAALTELAKEKFSPQVAYTILRNARKVEQVADPEMKTIQETGNKMIEEKKAVLGEDWTKDENNKNEIDQINKALDALLENEVEVDVRPLSLDQLNCQVQVGVLADLDWMFTFPEEEAPVKPERKRHSK